jgi:hypothetical protein
LVSEQDVSSNYKEGKESGRESVKREEESFEKCTVSQLSDFQPVKELDSKIMK